MFELFSTKGAWAKTIVLGTALFVFGGCGKMGPSSASGGNEHELVGATAPSFELPAQAGGSKASLSEGSGKVTIVDFWATWCEPCEDSFPHYQKMLEQHAGELVIVGVSEDDKPDGIAAFAKKTGAKFPLGWDDGKSVSAQYHPPSMPTSYMIDRSGIVRYVHVGFHKGDQDEIEANVSSLVK